MYDDRLAIAASYALARRLTLLMGVFTTGVLAASSLEAQSVPTRALTRPDARLDEPFTYVGAIRELRDGRVIVMDSRDKILQLADLRSGTVTQIGREGAGPGEYGMPRSVLPMPGDSSVVYDMLNSRFLVILPNGKPGATFRLDDAPAPRTATPTPGAAAPALAAGSLRNPRATDARGRLYFEGSPITMGPEGPTTADSVPVLRHDRATNRTDTAAWLQMPKNAASVTQSGGGNRRSVEMRVGSTVPFDSRDSWDVFPDGRIAIVRLADYHIDVITPNGTKVSGPRVPFTPVRVGAAEKEEFRQRSQRTPGISMSITDNNGARSTTVNTSPRPFDEPATWPAVKPPFVNGGIYVRDNGDIWVQRQVRADDPPTFDVFNTAGRLLQRITLPKGHRLVGFGSGTVYTVSLDEDDLQYLQRFRA